jgi:hypothetical protein
MVCIETGMIILFFQAPLIYSPLIVAPRMPNSPNSGMISLWKSTHYKNSEN